MPDVPQYRIAQVALNAAGLGYDRLYSYRIPEDLDGSVQPGVRVAVPFGRGNRRRIAMVLAVAMQTELPETALEIQKLKPIAAVLDTAPVLTEELLSLVEWLYEHTLCTWFDAVKAVLPGGMQIRLEEHYLPVPRPASVKLTEQEENLLSMILHAQSQRERDLLLQSDGSDQSEKQAVLESLTAKGCLVAVTEGKRAIGDSTQRMVRLTEAFLEDESKFSPTPKQRTAIAVLREHTALSVKECAYYAGVSEAVVNKLLHSGIAECYTMSLLRVPRDAVATISPKDTVLSEQQQAAYQAVAETMLAGKAAAFLLYGVTGSGKTAVFEQLIALALSEGKQALLLLPEIALTPQIVQYFQARFGNRVALLHSGLSLGQRLDTDKLIRSGEVQIVIGTRSAVFAPLANLGLIILDEEGEHSYKSDQSPRYHAADVAKARCRIHKAALVLASATPSLESRYLAERGVYRLLTMTKRYNQAPLPEVSVVDMNMERANGNGSPFSLALAEALQENLRKGEQSILLLNRRGYHTLLQCTKCYEPVYCPNCSVPMTYHKANNSLLCHYCGAVQPPVTECPACGNEKLRQMGFGTQKLEEELQLLLPQARILRMDADTTMTRTAYETGFRAFANGEYDILAGTQMIGKGLDFPNVTLVGVVSIDKALYAGDFRSYERTFSLITQVVGRGGRGKHPGRAILQTYMPDHYVLNLAAAQDYDSFYHEELALRRALMFPPICDICVIGFSGVWEEKVQAAAKRFVILLRDTIQKEQFKLPLRVLGPVPANYGRLHGKYRWRVLLKCKNTAQMRQLIRGLMERAAVDKQFHSVQLFADMNGDCGV
ncbi:MAG: primosomal protein N' [Oscillospiraceae bacterium]|nr:primosomal protein N' [Oscillospiraceae bacterium]